jgi:hypothetical protein
MLFKKCTGCKYEFTREELEEEKLKQKKSKENPLKNVCPYCRAPLKIYDESKFHKKWYGYLSDDKSVIEHLVLVEFKYYDDNSCEVKIPLLDLVFETKNFSEMINIANDDVVAYLKDKYKKVYGSKHIFLTVAWKEETIAEKQNVAVWW